MGKITYQNYCDIWICRKWTDSDGYVSRLNEVSVASLFFKKCLLQPISKFLQNFGLTNNKFTCLTGLLAKQFFKSLLGFSLNCENWNLSRLGCNVGGRLMLLQTAHDAIHAKTTSWFNVCLLLTLMLISNTVSKLFKLIFPILHVFLFNLKAILFWWIVVMRYLNSN